MAKKPKKDSPLKAALEQRDLDIMEQIAALRGNLGPSSSGIQLRIFRHNEPAHEWEILAHVALKDFSIEDLMKQYGGGEYRGWAIGPNGKRVKTDGDIRWRVAGPPLFPNSAAVQPNGGAQMEGWLTQRIDKLEQLIAGQHAGGAEMAKEIAKAMGAGLTSGMEMMSKLAGAHSGGGMKETVETITAVLGLVDRLGGDRAPDPGDMIWKGTSAIAKALSDVAAAQRAAGVKPIRRINAAPAQPAPIAPAAAAPAAPPPPPEETMPATPLSGAQLLEQLRPTVAQLVGLAAEEADPELYADVTLDRLARKKPDVLRLLVADASGTPRTAEGRAELQQQLLAAFPETQPYAQWFADFFEDLWAAVDEELARPQGSGNPPPAADDDDDAAPMGGGESMT